MGICTSLYIRCQIYICIIALFSIVAVVNLNEFRCMSKEFKDIYLIHSFSCGPFLHVGNYYKYWIRISKDTVPRDLVISLNVQKGVSEQRLLQLQGKGLYLLEML